MEAKETVTRRTMTAVSRGGDTRRRYQTPLTGVIGNSYRYLSLLYFQSLLVPVARQSIFIFNVLKLFYFMRNNNFNFEIFLVTLS